MNRLFFVLLFLIVGAVHAQRSDFDSIDFRNADSIAFALHGNDLFDLPQLAAELTEELTTDVEKFRSIYRWVCDNISYHHGFYAKNQRKRNKHLEDAAELKEWNDGFAPRVFNTLVKDKTTVCTGYAYLVKVLAAEIGLECVAIDGYGRRTETNIGGEGIPNHTWNAVKLNGRWYLCDPTWSAGFVLISKSTFFVKDYSDGYFLADPQLFVRNHYPQDTSWLLGAEMKKSDFLMAPIIYKEALELNVAPAYPEQLHVVVSKNGTVDFGIELLSGVTDKNVAVQIGSGEHATILHPKLKHQDETTIFFQLDFKYRGTYSVHIMVADKIVWTYEIKVVKDEKV